MTTLAEASQQLEALAIKLGFQLVTKHLEAIPQEPLPEFLVYHRRREDGVIEGFSEAANSPLEALGKVHQALGYGKERSGAPKPAPLVTLVK
jgi:hypothetical protein